ncbi:hypothetical protein HW130_17190 [Streptomyces sp. PKU-EA00015]|uniref:hypothetical protein n=1 Tax=Streptomyces sp. PKU-EA00015 TaxID=2748326 RepID=UPI0015A27D0A|nr:hypothetical protein [Streptomyces sp. PKU-EA00015]NWF27980.1 hypothetical protein [Streptomyces sp. PKU-EA00015]GGT21829.1 hypothetical protein GCM10010271_26450 [Streptomyces kurssanovii]
MNTRRQPSAPTTQPTLAAEPTNSAWIPWLLVMVLSSALVAVCVGFLKVIDGAPVSGALLSAGAAFGGTALLCLAVVPVVQQLRQRG